MIPCMWLIMSKLPLVDSEPVQALKFENTYGL